MKEMYSKVVKSIQLFKESLNELESIRNQCEVEISNCDKAICDIRHFCELQCPNTYRDKTKVCKLLTEYTKSRRIAKDTLFVLKPLLDYSLNHSYLRNEISIISNNMAKSKDRIDNGRVYVPRLLVDLFKDSSIINKNLYYNNNKERSTKVP
jgi:hypothetical protein